MEERVLAMPDTYQKSSCPPRTRSSLSRTQSTALNHPGYARPPVVDGSHDGFQMEVAGRYKKRHGRSLV